MGARGDVASRSSAALPDLRESPHTHTYTHNTLSDSHPHVCICICKCWSKIQNKKKTTNNPNSKAINRHLVNKGKMLHARQIPNAVKTQKKVAQNKIQTMVKGKKQGKKKEATTGNSSRQLKNKPQDDIQRCFLSPHAASVLSWRPPLHYRPCVPAQQAGESDAGVFLGLNLVIPAAAQRRSTRPSWFPAYQNYPPSSPQQHAISTFSW